jgi:hypothetical protein
MYRVHHPDGAVSRLRRAHSNASSAFRNAIGATGRRSAVTDVVVLTAVVTSGCPVHRRLGRCAHRLAGRFAAMRCEQANTNRRTVSWSCFLDNRRGVILAVMAQPRAPFCTRSTAAPVVSSTRADALAW